jgi:hypothetical protein
MLLGDMFAAKTQFSLQFFSGKELHKKKGILSRLLFAHAHDAFLK